MAATLDQSTPWLGLCHHTDTKVPMAATLDQSTPWLGLCHHTDTKAPMAATLDQSTPWLGLCHHTDTKATLKCCYALHGFVGTIFSYNEFLEQQHPLSII